MEILQTKDYDAFEVIVSNREVDKNHVKRLATSIRKKNLLYIRPVIVNKKLQVIDGQHRIEACRAINETVHYLIAEKLTKDDIAILNTAQKNWTRLDFINFFAIEGNPQYKKLSHLINKYPVTVSFLLRFAEGNVRHGNLRVVHYDQLVQCCDWIVDLRNQGYAFVLERDFGLAFRNLIKTHSDYEQLVTHANPDNFYKCSSLPDYRRMISKVALV